MKLRSLIIPFALSLFLLAPTTARADCTEGGSTCDIGPLVAGATIAGIVDGGIFITGIVTMARGASELTHHRGHHWRKANYAFGVLNLLLGTVWAGLSPLLNPVIGISVAIPHFGVGAGNLTVALVSQHRGDDGVNLSFAPLVGRDSSGRPLTGASVRLTF